MPPPSLSPPTPCPVGPRLWGLHAVRGLVSCGLTSCRRRGFHVASRFELICRCVQGGVRGLAEMQRGAWMEPTREAAMAAFAIRPGAEVRGPPFACAVVLVVVAIQVARQQISLRFVRPRAFQICKERPTKGLALPLRPLSRLAQDEEPGAAPAEARGWSGSLDIRR
jgi:hypothetical protein